MDESANMPHDRSYKIVTIGWYLTSSTTNHNGNLSIKHREPRSKYCHEGATSYCFHGLILKLDIDIWSLKAKKPSSAYTANNESILLSKSPIIIVVSIFHFNSSTFTVNKKMAR